MKNKEDLEGFLKNLINDNAENEITLKDAEDKEFERYCRLYEEKFGKHAYIAEPSGTKEQTINAIKVCIERNEDMLDRILYPNNNIYNKKDEEINVKKEEIIEELVNEIKVMPNDTEFTIGNLLMRYNDIINDDEVMELSLKIIGILKEKNITIGSDRESGYIGGLPQNFKYKRIINPSQENKDNKQEIIQAIKNKENALKYIKNDKDVDVICDIICKPKENKDPFWYDMAKNLLKAIIYYLKNTDNENVSIQRCKEIIEKTITSNEPRKVMEELLVGFDNNSNVKNLYRPIEIAPDKTFLCIFNTLNECLVDTLA